MTRLEFIRSLSDERIVNLCTLFYVLGLRRGRWQPTSHLSDMYSTETEEYKEPYIKTQKEISDWLNGRNAVHSNDKFTES